MSPKATVKVQVVLEVDVDAGWGKDCTIGQARAQGVENAERTVRLALEGGEPERKRIRMVGIKSVDVIIRSEP